MREPEKRLSGFWGRVDRRQIDLIASWVRGPKVLDLGCGYGSLTAGLEDRDGVACTGVDVDEEALAIARRLFPRSEFVRADAASLPFDSGSFDTIVLRDSLHHLVNESDWDTVARELLRVSADDARLVVFDPNVHGLLRLARRLSRHEDEECSIERAVPLVEALGYRPVHTDFHALYTLPLSGGYVGPELVPNRRRLADLLLRADDGLDRLFDRLGLGRRLAWRYLLVADRGAP